MGKPPTALHIREAERLGHNGIGCEHLLLGILANQDGPAARVLARHGVTLERARRRTGEMIGDGWQESVRWSYSPRATVVRRLAEVEAERLGELEPSDAHTPTAQGLGGRAAVARRAEGKTTIAVILYLRRALWLAGDALARRMRGAAPGEVDQLAAPVALEDLSAPFGWDSDQELGEFPGAHVRRARS